MGGMTAFETDFKPPIAKDRAANDGTFPGPGTAAGKQSRPYPLSTHFASVIPAHLVITATAK